MTYPALSNSQVFGGGGAAAEVSLIGEPYRAAVFSDEPVFAYGFGNSSNSTDLYNMANATADGTNNATKSADVAVGPPIYDPLITSGQTSFFFPDSGTPYVQIPSYSGRSISSTEVSFDALFRSFDLSVENTIYSAGYSSFLDGYSVGVTSSSIIVGGSLAGFETFLTISGAAISEDVDHHIAITFDNTLSNPVVNAYLDGAFYGTASFSEDESLTDSGNIGFIGAKRSDQYEDNFRGLIQGVAQYDYILTTAQISAHYNAINKIRNPITAHNANRYRAELGADSPEGLWYLNAWEQGSTTSGFTDSSGNGNNGTAIGDIQQGVGSLGDGGNASLFIPRSTSDVAYITIPYDAGIRHTNQSTVIASICPVVEVDSESWINGVIFACGDQGVSAHQQYALKLNASGTLSVRYYYNSSDSDTITTTEAIPDFVSDGSRAYSVACVVDTVTDEVKIYVDGTQLGDTLDMSFTMRARTTGLNIIGAYGSTGTFNDAGFSGVIGNVAFYQTALSDERIAALHSLLGAVSASNVDGYIARWSMDDISGSTAPNHSLTSGLNGTLVNSPTRVEGYDEVTDGALEFNGVDQYVSLSDTPAIKPIGNMTACGWAKPNSTSQPIFTCYMSSSGGDAHNGTGGYYLGTEAAVVGDNTGFVTGLDRAFASNPIQDALIGEWHHYTMTYDGATLRYYIDGVEISTSSWVGNINYSEVIQPAIGALFNDDNLDSNSDILLRGTFDGCLDDIRLYDRALLGVEIFFLARTTIPPKPQDMIAEYKFQSDATDSIGSADMTGIGTPTYSAAWEDNGIDFNGSSQYARALNALTGALQLQTQSVSFFYNAVAGANAGTDLISLAKTTLGDAALGWKFRIDGASNLQYVEYNSSNNIIVNLNATIGTGYEMREGVWVHACVTRNGTTATIYLDGEEVRSLSTGENIGYNSEVELVAGARRITDFGSGYDDFFEGSLDELRIYDRVLSQAEVRALALRDVVGTAAQVGDGSPADPPTFTTVTLDIDVADITATESDTALYTSATLTATASNGSGQFDFAWTVDDPRINLVFDPDGSDSSSTVNTNGFTIINAAQEIVTATITCTVTDLGDGSVTAQDTTTVNLTFGTTNDYVAYWTMDESDLTGLVMADQTSNNHDGTFDSAAAFQTGRNGQAFAAAGVNYMSVPDDADFKPAAFSVSLWAYINSSVTECVLFESGCFPAATVAYQGYRIIADNNTGRIGVLCGDNSGITSGNDYTTIYTPSSSLAQEQLVHVVVTYDGTDLKIYIDATEEADSAPSFTIAWPTTNFVTVAGSTYNGGTLNAQNFAVDEIKVYDRELSAAEVTEINGIAATPAAPSTPFSASATPLFQSAIVFSYEYTEFNISAIPNGGVGPFTYSWAKAEASLGLEVVSGATSSQVTVGGFGGGASGEQNYVFEVTITDTGNGNATATAEAEIFVNWGGL